MEKLNFVQIGIEFLPPTNGHSSHGGGLRRPALQTSQNQGSVEADDTVEATDPDSDTP